MKRNGRNLALAAVVGAIFVGGAAFTATRFHGGDDAAKVAELGHALAGPGSNDYVAAIADVRRREARSGDGDVEVAGLMLQSLADPHPATRPVATVESSLWLMERAAAADPDRNAAVIEATMRYGVADPGGRSLFGPRPAVANCWSRVRAKAEPATACIALRRDGG